MASDMNTSTKKERVSIILPTYNEFENIRPLIKRLLQIEEKYELELLIIDDDSTDGTTDLVKKLAQEESRIRIIHRVGRSGLASAIKEGLLDATGDIAVVMDSDGQHDPLAISQAISLLKSNKLDIVAGSRFLRDSEILGLSQRRTGGSSLANKLARFSLSKQYQHLTDYMSGFMVFKMHRCMPSIYKVDVNGFKFFYELLSISRGRFNIEEIPLNFLPRNYGSSKLDLSILWDFVISLVHTFSFRVIPRRAISFGLVGATGMVVQLTVTKILMGLLLLEFQTALPVGVVAAATSNYLINNALTFRSQRLNGRLLIKGLLKFLLVASLPVLANVGLATSFYRLVASDPFLAQLAGIIVVFVWNYAASSRFVWNTP